MTTSGRGKWLHHFQEWESTPPSLVGDVWGDGCFGLKGFFIGIKILQVLKGIQKRYIQKRRRDYYNVDQDFKPFVHLLPME